MGNDLASWRIDNQHTETVTLNDREPDRFTISRVYETLWSERESSRFYAPKKIFRDFFVYKFMSNIELFFKNINSRFRFVPMEQNLLKSMKRFSDLIKILKNHRFLSISNYFTNFFPSWFNTYRIELLFHEMQFFFPSFARSFCWDLNLTSCRNFEKQF